VGLIIEHINGQTPLDEDEKEGLIIKTIATREELDEFEHQNIEEAIQWIMSRSFQTKVILTEYFVMNLHKRMYGNVWSWAGEFRKTNKNLGIDKWQIPTALKALLDDTLYWIENKIFSPDEIAVRFKHRIVCIHCFTNGNGRHSRLMADIIIDKIYKLPAFSWGSNNLSKQTDTRAIYLKAVKEADKNNYEPLLLFSRT
jgi:Fic-DOC domain mobile mystery protein B